VTPDDDEPSEAPGGAPDAGGAGDELELLHHAVEELQRENELLRAGEAASGHGRRLAQVVTSWVVLVLACLLAIVSVVAVFAHNQLLDTDTYVATVAPLAGNPAIQTQVATRVSEELDSRLHIEQRVKDALPVKAGFLAGPIANEVQRTAYAITLRLVQSPQFEQLWITANRVSHQQVVALLTGSSHGALSSSDGTVTLDLGQVETAVKDALVAKGLTIFDKVPPITGANLVLFQSDDLSRIQRLTRLFTQLVVVIPILSLLLFAAAVALARNRRRGLVRAAAGLALSMVVLVVVVNAATSQYLSGVNPPGRRAAQAAVVDTVSAPLTDGARTVLMVGAVAALLAVVAGLSVVQRLLTGRRLPGWMTGGPVHDVAVAHRPGLQWGVLAVGLFVLVVWDRPTVLVAVVVVLITVAVVGLVGLFAGRRVVPPRPPSLDGGPAG
jgi:hypothetical protein